MVVIGAFLLALVVESVRSECATIQCGIQTSFAVVMQTVAVPAGKAVTEMVSPTTCINGPPVGMIATVCGSATPSLHCVSERSVTVARGVEADAQAEIDILVYCRQPYHTGLILNPTYQPIMPQSLNLPGESYRDRNGGLHSLFSGNLASFTEPFMSGLNPSSYLPFLGGKHPAQSAGVEKALTAV